MNQGKSMVKHWSRMVCRLLFAGHRRCDCRAMKLPGTFLIGSLVSFLGATGAMQPAWGAEPSSAEVFGHTILPILERKCVACHAEHEREGDLDLSSFESLLTGGSSGPALDPDDRSRSLLLERIRSGEMPPEDEEPLTVKEASSIEQWVRSSDLPDTQTILMQRSQNVHARASDLWSFQPVRETVPPKVRNSHLVKTPIDRFILQRLEAEQARLAPEADRRTRLRRVTFNLTGLPPTPDEINDFLTDESEIAWDRVIERLLESPHYGERWGRHWLDVAGWAESSLLIGDHVHPGFWRYRDWVIRAFNNNMPYDQFVREQLAGDEMVAWRNAETLDQEMIDKLTATGFLRCTPDGTDNQPITQEEKIYATQQTAVEVATKALLGLTINCVRCHDHKYDPVTQREYYSLIAIFQPAYDPENWIPGMVNIFGAGPARMIPIAPRQERIAIEQRLQELKRRNDEFVYQKEVGIPNRYRDQHIEKHVEELPVSIDRTKLSTALRIEERQRTDEQKALVFEAAKHFELGFERLKELYPQLSKDQNQNNQQHKEVKQEGQRVGDVIWALWDVSTNPSPTRFLIRGEFTQPAGVVEPGVLQTLRPEFWQLPSNADLPEQVPAGSTTYRRTAFANWITHPEHPLTARVMVNRIWQYHFGTGLVSTPDDFGARGARPSHPELLDWLATELVRSGWSIKHLHRLILRSAVYRQASGDSEVDPSLLATFPRRRLEAEAIRDAALSVAGKLDPTFFGESVPTKKSADGSDNVPSTHPGRYRRSVYLSTRRTTLPTLLTLFDAPSMDTNWPQRYDSAIAPQALALMNHPEWIACATAFAARVQREAATDAERLEHLFALAYTRLPASEELELMMSVLNDTQTADLSDRWTTIAHAILASNEFLYVD